MIRAAAGDLDPSVPQRHAYPYRGPADIPTDEVTIVGGGNSAAQIALELTASHRVTLVAPREPWFVPARVLGLSSYRWMSWLGIPDADVEWRVVRRVRRRGDAIFGQELRRPLRPRELVLRTSHVVGAAGRTLTHRVQRIDHPSAHGTHQVRPLALRLVELGGRAPETRRRPTGADTPAAAPARSVQSGAP